MSKKVQFKDVVEVHDVKCIDDYTVEERSQIWIDAAEYSRIRKENQLAIDMIDDGLLEEHGGEETCFRGLENKSTVGSKFRRNLKQEAREVVLSAQEIQHDELLSGNLDWEPIREAYISISSESISAAQEVGLTDAFNAWRAYQKSQGDDAQKLRRSRPIVKSSPIQPPRRFSHIV